jgi:Common central domain of tyrosinase/Polyphenol oxidase middle domain
MKTISLPFIGLFCCLFSTAILLYNEKPTTKNLTVCAAPANSFDATAEYFKPNTALAIVVRKNVYSLTAAEITTLKTGIAAMKALPTTNPTSWTYQAAIHGTTLSNNLPSWNSCQHGTQFFLSWHRMYLYYFERILRSKSGNPNFALPYWNYQTNPALHAAYRNSAASNTLYDGTRNASINGGGSLSAGIMTSIVNSLNHIPFTSFNSNLENPHGAVHVAIGGNMGAVNRAATDPVFWLHHTNIDRLWVEWLRKCGGRENPTTGPWMTQVFTFFDENGNAVNMTGSQIVNTSTQLGYRYDFPFKLPCNFVIPDFRKWRWIELPPFKLKENIRLINNKHDFEFDRLESASWDATVSENKIEKLAFRNNDISDQILLELDGLSIAKQPEGAVEVYLNLPKNEVPNHRSKSFVGVLDLFSAAGHEGHNGHSKIRIDASNAVKLQGLDMAKLKKSNISFFVRGNGVKGRAIKTKSDISIMSMSFVLLKGQKE